ncbi:hypothetical protein ACFIOY_20610 [Bradyrhizobium sp. TZ2]
MHLVLSVACQLVVLAAPIPLADILANVIDDWRRHHDSGAGTQICGREHSSRHYQTIVLGFAADPMARWVWPDSSEYLRSMPQFIKAFGGRAFDRGTAYVTEGVRAAALSLPPGVDPDEAAMDEVMAQTLRPEIADSSAARRPPGFGRQACPGSQWPTLLLVRNWSEQLSPP